MNNIKPLYPLTLAMLLPATTSAFAAKKTSSESTENRKPNVIFIMTDDQGKGDLSCTGNPYIKTPNIDKFYEDAVRLDNYHVSTTSAPTRSSIMTGRHCNRVNVFHTIAGRSIVFTDEVMMSQVFAQNGYTNALYGKWHLGDNYPNRPEDRAFHEVVRIGGGGIGQGPDYWLNDYFDDTYYHNGVPEKYEGYCTDVFFEEAMDFITKNKDNPFFIYLAPNAPHSPHNVPEEYYKKYSGTLINGEPIGEDLHRFYAMISNIDDNFAKLEKHLQKLGIADNTILIFTTDNGTITPARMAYNVGMTGGKGSPMEGGHRVPFFMRWKDGKLDGGKDINQLVAHYDLLPTFVDLLDLDFNPVKPLDGKSLKPLLTEENPEWENRILYMDTQRQQNLIKYKSFVMMDDNWRLLNGKQLYNINDDLAQEHNVIDQHPEVAAHLMDGYERWWASMMAENVDERFGYIQVGSPKENPSMIMSHDMHIGAYKGVWDQPNVFTANQATGYWKVEFLETAEYAITLCRFPRESGWAINQKIEAEEPRIELARTMPAAVKDDFVTAQMYVAGISKTADIGADTKKVTFKCRVPKGKFDFQAELIDSEGHIHPAYYVYIEKL
ncbi:MAG: arylsulfatase [Rikenellaceae bacterium]